MRHPRTSKLLILLAAWHFFNIAGARAEWGYGVSGNLGSGFSYTRETQGDTTTWSTARTDNYSLGLNGRILDPRLATFSIGGALSMSDFSSNQKSSAADSRLLSFIGNLSLLPAKPYPLDLRLSQSHLGNEANTDILSFGGSWRMAYGDLPLIFVDFDRVNIQSAGLIQTDTTFTTGSMRLAKRLGSSDLDAEFGVQNFADEVRDTSSLRHFGRFSDVTSWSPATSLTFTGNYSIQEESRSLGSNFSLFNRPDPTLSRTLSLGVLNISGKEREETSLDASSAISKALNPYPTLTITPFTTARLNQRFASGSVGDSNLLNWSTGASTVSSYFTSVLATGGYGLGLSFTNEEEGESAVGTTQQFQVGLESRTLYPYRVRGDYSFLLERTQTDRNRHQASLRADGPLTSNLFFRSFTEFFNENARFSSLGTKTSASATTLTLGAGLSYTGIRQLYFDLGATASRSETETSPAWITRLTANLNYRPRERLTLMLTGLRETDTLNDLTRFETIAQVLYQFGQSTVNFEYRFESRTVFDRPGQGHSVMIRVNRPFRFSF